MATGFEPGIAPKSEAPDTGADPGGAEAELYTWTELKQSLIVQNRSTSPATMYLRINATAAGDASTSVCDVVLAPGDRPFTTGDFLGIKSLAVYFSDAATQGTDFTIRAF